MIAIVTNVAAVTFTVAEPCIPFKVAVIEVLPTPRLVTSPLLVNVLLTSAIEFSGLTDWWRVWRNTHRHSSGADPSDRNPHRNEHFSSAKRYPTRL